MDQNADKTASGQVSPSKGEVLESSSASQVEKLSKDKGSEKKSNKKLLVIIIILLVILLFGALGVIGYILIKGDDSTKQEEQTEESKEEDEDADAEEDNEDESDTTETVDTGSCIATGFDGETYEDGESYTTLDGCQTCSCDRGEWDCSVDPVCEMDPTDCVYEGTVYNDGDTKNIDACRDRECSSGMWIIVIDSTCCEQDGTYYENGESFPSSDGCNTCTCTMGASLCTMMLCP